MERINAWEKYQLDENHFLKNWIDWLFIFFQKEQGNSLALMNKMPSDESMKTARPLGITDFKAWNMNIKWWKNRFNMPMSKGTNESQKLPVDYAKATAVFLKAICLYCIINDNTAKEKKCLLSLVFILF